MVATNRSSPFSPGRSVRLVIGLLAWPGDPGDAVTHLQRVSHARTRAAGPRQLTVRDDLVFVRRRTERPGGSVVRDLGGNYWNVPDDYLAAPNEPITPTGAAA